MSDVILNNEIRFLVANILHLYSLTFNWSTNVNTGLSPTAYLKKEWMFHEPVVKHTIVA